MPGSEPPSNTTGLRYIGSYAPLFIHQYSQAWFDFRGKRDRYADYFKNSVTATEVHRRFCLELAKQFPDYSDDLWGITASDSQHGYVVWGGPPEIGPDRRHGGSERRRRLVAVSARSHPARPEKHQEPLRPQAWSRYGFVNAFNPLKAGTTPMWSQSIRASPC